MSIYKGISGNKPPDIIPERNTSLSKIPGTWKLPGALRAQSRWETDG